MRSLILPFTIVIMIGLIVPVNQSTLGQLANQSTLGQSANQSTLGQSANQSTLGQSANQSSVFEPLVCAKAKDQPVDSVQMNSALIDSSDADNPGDNVKTIHVEKEIFSCSRPGGPVGSVSLYRDLTIYAEVFGSSSGPAFFPSQTTFIYSVCDRNVTGDILSCSASPVTGRVTNLTRCTEETPIPSIEANTLNAKPNPKTVKTITSEKHIYTCSAGDLIIPTKVKEVVIFTSLYENGLSSSISFMGFTCIKDTRLAKVDYCGITFTS